MGKQHTDEFKLKLSKDRTSNKMRLAIEKYVINYDPTKKLKGQTLTVVCDCNSVNTISYTGFYDSIKTSGAYTCRNCGYKATSNSRKQNNALNKGFDCEEDIADQLIATLEEKRMYLNDPVILKKFKSSPSYLAKLLHNNGRADLIIYDNYESTKEQSLFNELRELIPNSIEIKRHYRRKALKGKEIDIYIPHLKIGIEFNGLYWHSELHKPKNYHREKRELCEALGIQLIQINGDEFAEKKDIALSIIKAKLGLFENKYFARKTQLKTVPLNVANNFLENNHLMGASNGISAVGLYVQNELVSLITFKKYKDGVDIVRFCNKLNTVVVGGLSKLLKFIENERQPAFIQSFVDLRYGNGHSLEAIGFKLEKITLGWKWVDSKKTRNRMYCKANMDSRGLSEAEHAAELGLYKIYDAGQAKFIKTRS